MAGKASKTVYGHVKVGAGITVTDGEISVSEMTASNVTTTQGPSVQASLDNLKSDTDSKIQSVATAIISKGGTVAGTPPTAGQLVDGVGSIPTGLDVAFVPQVSSNLRLVGLDNKGNTYYHKTGPYIGDLVVIDKNATIIKTVAVGSSMIGGNKDCVITYDGVTAKVYNHALTLLYTATISSADSLTFRMADEFFFGNIGAQLVVCDAAGTIIGTQNIPSRDFLGQCVLSGGDMPYFLQTQSFGVVQKIHYQLPTNKKLGKSTIISTNELGYLDLQRIDFFGVKR